MPERILVTGAAGFLGRHCLAHLAAAFPAAQIYAADRMAPSVQFHHVMLSGLTSQPAPRQDASEASFTLFRTSSRGAGDSSLDCRRSAACGADPLRVTPEFISLAADLADLADPAAARQAIAASRPDWVLHLAGMVGQASWADLLRAHVETTVNLFEALVEAGLRPRVVVIGSAAEYGVVPVAELPVAESRPPQPATRYAATKAAQTAIALSYAAQGFGVTVGRAFNILGPGMSERLSLGSFAAQIGRIERGEQPPALAVGNLAHRRDYLDVRDVAAGLAVLAERGQAGQVYNICRGESARMSDLVALLIGQARVPVTLAFDPARQTAVDAADSYGDNRRLLALGWSPRIALAESLADMLSHIRTNHDPYLETLHR
jgi:GDP-4-dehydro-6-deoxy-D-mannose reductase